MNKSIALQFVLFLTVSLSVLQINAQQNKETDSHPTIVESDIMVRLSEIAIFPEYLQEYNAILKEEAAASVRKEQGVIAIFPMYQQNDSTQLRIVEIYANKAAYQSHLKTPHFQHYKTTTLKMVKSLRLVDMEALDKNLMLEIFKKMPGS